MSFDFPDTIVALSSGRLPSGIAVIRISGKQTRFAVETISGKLPPPRIATYATLRNPAGETIDSGLILFFPAPHSFTGEDCAEFQIHGGKAVVTALARCADGVSWRSSCRSRRVHPPRLPERQARPGRDGSSRRPHLGRDGSAAAYGRPQCRRRAIPPLCRLAQTPHPCPGDDRSRTRLRRRGRRARLRGRHRLVRHGEAAGEVRDAYRRLSPGRNHSRRLRRRHRRRSQRRKVQPFERLGAPRRCDRLRRTRHDPRSRRTRSGSERRKGPPDRHRRHPRRRRQGRDDRHRARQAARGDCRPRPSSGRRFIRRRRPSGHR